LVQWFDMTLLTWLGCALVFALGAMPWLIASLIALIGAGYRAGHWLYAAWRHWVYCFNRSLSSFCNGKSAE